MLHSLNQTNASHGVQFGKQPHSFVVPTVKGGLDFVKGVMDIDPTVVVVPMVLN